MVRNRKQFLRRAVMFILILLSGAILSVLLIPSPIEATYWNPPQPPPLTTEALSVNDKLQKAELLAEGEIEYPEDIAFDDKGRLYTGSSDGFVYRVIFDEAGDVQNIERFAETGGYPSKPPEYPGQSVD